MYAAENEVIGLTFYMRPSRISVAVAPLWAALQLFRH